MAELSQALEEKLSALHDIHLPNPIGWWPLAPIWYILIIIGFLLIFGVSYYFWRTYHTRKVKRQALAILELLEQEYQATHNSQKISAEVSLLLKRFVLAYYPRKQVAGLTGEEWIAFLNKNTHKLDFNSIKDELLIYPYLPSHQKDLTLLFSMVRRFFKQVRKICSS